MLSIIQPTYDTILYDTLLMLLGVAFQNVSQQTGNTTLKGETAREGK